MKTIGMLFFVVLNLLIWTFSADGQNTNSKSNSFILIDSISIKKNWRTNAKIIFQELDFKPGDRISRGSIDTAMMKIWNIGNFSLIDYQIDTISGGRTLLTITAKDAFTIVPNLSFNGNKRDFQFSAGINDDNFWGRNIKLNVTGSTGTNSKYFNLFTSIPRQLLYRNMSVKGSVTYGNAMNYRYKDDEKIFGVGYHKKEISGVITNPWNEDFKYKFSPDFGWSIIQHISDSTLISPNIQTVKDFKISYFQMGLSESIGYVKYQRHQRDGYNVEIGFGVGVGLNQKSPNFHSLSMSASYYKLFNPVVQFCCTFSTAYTSTEVPSLTYYRADVKGTLAGEVSGKAYYAASVGSEFTYINRQWLSLVHSVYLNLGNGSNQYFRIFSGAPFYSAYTRFKFAIPTIPWLSISADFVWTKRNNNWVYLNF